MYIPDSILKSIDISISVTHNFKIEDRCRKKLQLTTHLMTEVEIAHELNVN